MLSFYKNLFEQIKLSYPQSGSEIIQKYIDLKISFYQENTALSIIEILDHLRGFADDPLNRKACADLYEAYSKSGFLSKNLNEKQLEEIRTRYIQEFIKLGKEYV